MTDSFWAQDHTVLWKKPSMFPRKDMTFNEKLNSITRLIGVLSLGVWAIGGPDGSISPLVIGVIGLIVVWTIWKYGPQKEKFEMGIIADPKDDPFSRKECKRPTEDNPFMNISPYDYGSNADFLPACRGPEIRKMSEHLFLKNTYEDGNDLFGRKSNNSRQWVVTPNKINPDLYQFYLNWRFKGNPTCKEDPRYCRPRMHAGQSWLDGN